MPHAVSSPLVRALRRALRFGLLLGLLTTISPPTARPVAAAGIPSATVTTERLGGADRYATAVAISQRLFPDGDAPVVYLVSGETFADALSAGPAAARAGGVVLLTAKLTLPPVVEAELVRLSPERVVFLGGTSAVSSAVADRVRTVLPGTTVTRIGGADRFETSARLSAATFPDGTDTVFIATGLNFPDAIAAGSPAAGLGASVLITRRDALPAPIAAELRRLAPARVVIVGSTGVVSDAVAAAIRSFVPTVERASGPNRYATAVDIGARLLPDATSVVIATGLNFPDALAAVPLAGSLGAPILLVEPEAVPSVTRDALIARAPTGIAVIGSTAAVGQITLGELVGWADGRLAAPPPGPTYPGYDSRYHDYGEMLTYIRAAEIAYPDIVQVLSIGKSYGGRDIWAAKISDNVATDEDEPEVLVDALHHAREHLTVEQALYLLKALSTGYSWSETIRRLVDERETWIVFAVNPDGWAYDLTGSPYVGWRKTRQPNAGTSAVGIDPNRNYSYRWGCCNGSSGNPAAWNYRGTAPWTSTETVVLRDFVLSRVLDGEQQIKTHVTLHTNGELILWPYGYTRTNIPADMTADDHATFAAMGGAMAALNGYTAQQSSDLYVTDGDQIDWMYATQGIFSFTFELYPTEQVSSHADHEPPDEVIAAQTARNRGALLYLIDMAACPYAAIGKASTYC
ncbi:MAG TPA: M14 family zinc carboxypeptidase [Candidatus Limnocylindrales bacterium]